MLDRRLTSIVEGMAESAVLFTGLAKEEYHMNAINRIRDECKMQDSNPDPYLKHYWAVYENEVMER